MKHSIITLALIAALLGTVSPVFAQAPTPMPSAEGITPAERSNTLEYETIRDTYPKSRFEDMSPWVLLVKILEVVNQIIVILALIGLIASGIMYITAGSDPDRANAARKNIIWVVTGLLIYLLVYFFFVRLAPTLTLPFLDQFK